MLEDDCVEIYYIAVTYCTAVGHPYELRGPNLACEGVGGTKYLQGTGTLSIIMTKS